MRITIIGTGTRGDVQPLIALANALRSAGHRVLFATEAIYSSWAKAAGADFHQLSGNSEALFSGRTGIRFREIVENSSHERYGRTLIATLWAKALVEHLQEVVSPCEGADFLICQPWFNIGPALSESFRIPVIIASPVPIWPTTEFPTPSQAARTDWTAEEILRSWDPSISNFMHESMQAWRVNQLGLEEITLEESLTRTRKCVHLMSYSPAFVPRPADWDEQAIVTGYWFSQSAVAYEPSEALRDFLAVGERPVVIGFGSHVGRSPEGLTQLVIEALTMAGRRGILVAGWGGLKRIAMPKNVFTIPEVPYDWMLQRASALVHHGGAGTTAISLLAGVPQIVVPFGWDQTFWGQRVAKQGVGTYFPAKTLTEEQLASGITNVLTDPGVQTRVAALSAAVRSETGTVSAVAAVERVAKQWQSGQAVAVG